jgi:hypothetical protein
MTLTPAIEATVGGSVYLSLNDLTAAVEARETVDAIEVVSRGVLAGRDGRPSSPPVTFRLGHRFHDDAVEIRARIDGADTARLAVPVVSAQGEAVSVSETEVAITRPEGPVVRVSASRPLRVDGPGRVFNHVPGVQAVPVVVEIRGGEDVVVTIRA